MGKKNFNLATYDPLGVWQALRQRGIQPAQHGRAVAGAGQARRSHRAQRRNSATQDLLFVAFAFTIGLANSKACQQLSALNQAVFCYPLINCISVHRQGSVYMVNTQAGNRLKVRTLAGYHVHRALSILRGDTEMPASTRIMTDEDRAFVRECNDLYWQITRLERLLATNPPITAAAAADFEMMRQRNEQRAAKRAARAGV